MDDFEQIDFPTLVADLFLAARDRGYAVGEHGMVYRHRIMPVDYSGSEGCWPRP